VIILSVTAYQSLGGSDKKFRPKRRYGDLAKCLCTAWPRIF